MKNLYIYIALSIVLASCNQLDLDPINALDQELFFRSDEDAVLAVNGVYAALVESESVVTAWLVDLGSDVSQNGESMPSGSGAELSSFHFNAGNAHTNYSWGDNYYGIANATALINKLDDPATPVSDRIRKRVRGEAKFLRAYYNSIVVQIFGEVPLLLESGYDAGVGVEREDVHKVYRQIVDDLTGAAEDLSEYPTTDAYGAADKGRITQQAAYGLLAKVYLVWAQTYGATDVSEKYGKAIEYADKVTGYALEEKFHANWEKDNRYGKEILFSANYVLSQESFGDGGNHLGHCAFSTAFDQQTPHLVVSDRTFYDRFDDRDQRKHATFLTWAVNPDNGDTVVYNLPRYAKYIDFTAPLTSAKNRELNASILRYAEVLLVKAEAINERNQGPNDDAYEAINKVRRRAFKVGEFDDGTAAPLTADSVELKNLSYQSFRKALRRERFYELTYEQVRWFDLVRWKVLIKTVKRVEASHKKDNVKPEHYRFPIPQTQRDLNSKLWQNWGYEGSTASTPHYA
ncbi:MAG: RagB/SusD family nutrient uptake outer membrane protein, partial [Prevotellaceae bacterium]|nr:RagB/SusD family nutrient uptake outer membrane protein [Prevotellaceae bacterium]